MYEILHGFRMLSGPSPLETHQEEDSGSMELPISEAEYGWAFII